MPLLIGWGSFQKRLHMYSVLSAAKGSWFAALLLLQISACTKSDAHMESRAGEKVSMRCPQYEGSTREWRATQSADGRLTLLLPPAYQPIRTDSGQAWASQVASISYRRSVGQVIDVPTATEPQACFDSLAGGAQIRYYHAQAATGVGYYLHAFYSMPDGTTIRLVGFSRDSADGKELLAVARSVRVKTP